VVKQAVKYVYGGADDANLEFVDKHISSEHPQALMEKLRDRRRQKSARPNLDADSPSTPTRSSVTKT
jgi:hypothetical protein